MKNILIYTNPQGFSEENKTLVKIQIDNSIDLGWSREDILLFTDFPYRWNGVEAVVINKHSDSPSHLPIDLPWDRTSNKIMVISNLLDDGLLEKDLYWYHDFDAYENEKIIESELEMDNYSVGLTGYGYKPQINGGSFFFKADLNSEAFFFNLYKDLIKIVRTRADEKTMTDMTRDGRMDRYEWKELNITYNFGQRCPKHCYPQADKPLKVLHFHPHYKFHAYQGHDNLDIFMKGFNPQGIPMMSERLIKIFKKHGIT